MNTERDPIAHVRYLPIPEQIKYAFARYCDQHADEYTPNERVTWPQLFKRFYSQSLNTYIRECRERLDASRESARKR